MQAKTTASGITFQVHDVEPCVEKLNTQRTDRMIKVLGQF
jgi:hypothetical protein